MEWFILILTSITWLKLISTSENFPVSIMRWLNESTFEIELKNGRTPEEISEWLILSSTLTKTAGSISPGIPQNVSSSIQKRDSLPIYNRLKLKDNLPTLYRSSFSDWSRVKRTKEDSEYTDIVRRLREGEQNETSLENSSVISTIEDNLESQTPSESQVSSIMEGLENGDTREQISLEEGVDLTLPTIFETSSDELGYSREVNTLTPEYKATTLTKGSVVSLSSNENASLASTFQTKSSIQLLPEIKKNTSDLKLDLELVNVSEISFTMTTRENKEKTNDQRRTFNGNEIQETSNILENVSTPRSLESHTGTTMLTSKEIVVSNVTLKASVPLQKEIKPPQINEVKVAPVLHIEYTILVIGITLCCIGFVLGAGGLLLFCTQKTKESPPNMVELMSSSYIGPQFEFRNPEEEV